MNRLKILYRDPRRKQPTKVLLKMIFLHVLAIIPILILEQSEWVKDNMFDPSESGMLDAVREIPVGYFVLYASIVAPLMEEAVFRAWMGLHAAAIVLFTTGATVYGGLVISPSFALGAGVVVLILTLIFLPHIKRNMDIRFQRWFYGSAILFGAIHLGNFGLAAGALLFILPQVILGLTIGLVRVQRGFWFGVLFHALWNGTISMLLLVPYFDSEEKVEEGDAFYATWETSDAFSFGSSSYLSSDSVNFENVLIEECLKAIHRSLDSEVIVELNGFSGVRINLMIEGDVQAGLERLSEVWSDKYNVKVNASEGEEDVYILSNIEDCEAEEIPGESRDVLQLLARYKNDAFGNSIARRMESLYEVKVRFEGDDAFYTPVIYPSEGLDSALHAAEYYSCLSTKVVKEEVKRIVVEAGEF
ncbi:CPBP family intramembrane glutamic endopeptidase [Phaeocystidibacter luteus]|uniref:CPBP family intramembrane metalloprotease n=1 Tax=Phaeocystidibacter luteus TaxID=911197 RepID=A0A6N6RHE8_9FLAO|nr:CPBP family intramembrane glutamic endopeptidase [Phaeocystidibacter luteus]KAB2813723.1 CPBP family intramembrane metalloprotease [Phaeocystidibacter luteus]